MNRRRFALLAIALVGCTGTEKVQVEKVPADIRSALEGAETFELYSLDPNNREEKPAEQFHDWKVLGKTTVTDAGTRDKLVSALRTGASENDGIAAACFNPRHGIRVTSGGTTTDLVICFECYSVNVYRGEAKSGSFLTTASPQPAFDEALTAAKVPLAK